MNRSAVDAGAQALVVSQVTLAADPLRGGRPSFDAAMAGERARELYEGFVARLRELGLPVSTGSFGERMEVELTGDGPVTFLLEEPPPVPSQVPPRP